MLKMENVGEEYQKISGLGQNRLGKLLVAAAVCKI